MSCSGLDNKVTGYGLHSQGLVLSRSREFLLCQQTDCPWGPPWVVTDHGPESGAKIKCARGFITVVSVRFHCLALWQLLHFILMSQEELVVEYTENVWYCVLFVHSWWGGSECIMDRRQVKCDVKMEHYMVYRNTVMNSLFLAVNSKSVIPFSN
jgi:hypothetical protein